MNCYHGFSARLDCLSAEVERLRSSLTPGSVSQAHTAAGTAGPGVLGGTHMATVNGVPLTHNSQVTELLLFCQFVLRMRKTLSLGINVF